MIKDVVAFGIIPEHATIPDACLPNEETQNCDPAIDEVAAVTTINSECLGKEICTIDIYPLLHKSPLSNSG